MVAFVASTVLTAANLNTAFNQKTINTQTGTTYTLVLTDQGGVVTTSNASAVTVTIPPNSSVAFATGTIIDFVNLGAGTLTIAAGAGVTVNGTITALAQYGFTSIIKTATNTWSYRPPGGFPASAIATVATNQSTTSASYTDLATAGPAVTITTGTKALVIVNAGLYNTTSGADASMSYAVSGATTVGVSDTWRLESGAYTGANVTALIRAGATYLATGLTAGSNTFTAKYAAASGTTGYFRERTIVVIDMGS